MEFPEDSPDLVMTYTVSAHDVDSKAYKSTSLREMVVVANKWQKKKVPSDSRPRHDTIEPRLEHIQSMLRDVARAPWRLRAQGEVGDVAWRIIFDGRESECMANGCRQQCKYAL